MKKETSDRMIADSAIQAQRAGSPKNAGPVPKIPAQRYTSAEFEALEREHVFGRSWLLAGRAEQVEHPGSYMQFKKLGAPILIVRGRDKVIRAFYNTCQHRGAAIVPEDQGRSSLLRCQFHSWSYDLTGRLVGVPEQTDFPCFSKDNYRLKQLSCEVWQGWIFINQDPDARPLAESMGAVLEDWDNLDMDRQKITFQRSWVVNCNWKATIDAFQEAYHLSTIHPETLSKAINAKAGTIELLPGGHSRHATPFTSFAMERSAIAREVNPAPEISALEEAQRVMSVTYYAFPNLLVSHDRSGVQMGTAWPRGPDQMELHFTGIGLPSEDGSVPQYFDEHLSMFSTILQEDMMNLESIQASLKSGALEALTLSHAERRIAWMHGSIDSLIGRERIPAGMAIEGFENMRPGMDDPDEVSLPDDVMTARIE